VVRTSKVEVEVQGGKDIEKNSKRSTHKRSTGEHVATNLRPNEGRLIIRLGS
jgi:hypothetical protein